jgi:rhodanese-related sulfurtransferase
MKTATATFLVCLLTAASSQGAEAQQPIQNPRIDFPAHIRAAEETHALRASRTITEDQFLAFAAQPGTVVLDARSAEKFKLRHIKGAVNFPFTEFTEESLAKVIPAKDTRVLIYCNNNFLGDIVAFTAKRAPASLNISTFINLTIYGYTNVYELGPLVNVKTTKLPLGGELSAQ